MWTILKQIVAIDKIDSHTIISVITGTLGALIAKLVSAYIEKRKRDAEANQRGESFTHALSEQEILLKTLHEERERMSALSLENDDLRQKLHKTQRMQFMLLTEVHRLKRLLPQREVAATIEDLLERDA